MRNEEKRAHGVRRAALALPCVRDELDPANDSAARDLRSFVGWLLSKKPSSICRVRAGPSGARRVAVLGDLAHARVVDEIHRVVFVDGIWIARDLVVLIACSGCTSCLGTSPAPRRPRLGGRCSRASRRLTWWSRTAAPGSPRQRRRSGRRRGSKDALSTRFAR